MVAPLRHIDDIINGVVKIIDKITGPSPGWNGDAPNPSISFAPYKLYNIGNNNPIELEEFISVLEECLEKKAERNLLPIQPGDVSATYADVDDVGKEVGFKPETTIKEGIKKFVEWYRDYYWISKADVSTGQGNRMVAEKIKVLHLIAPGIERCIKL